MIVIGRDDMSRFTVFVTRATTVYLTLSVSSEATYDKLTVSVGGTDVLTISGSSTRSVAYTLAAGESLVVKYSKDGSGNGRDDCGSITSLQLVAAPQ